jgi:hypothetical protein
VREKAEKARETAAIKQRIVQVSRTRVTESVLGIFLDAVPSHHVVHAVMEHDQVGQLGIFIPADDDG